MGSLIVINFQAALYHANNKWGELTGAFLLKPKNDFFTIIDHYENCRRI